MPPYAALNRAFLDKQVISCQQFTCTYTEKRWEGVGGRKQTKTPPQNKTKNFGKGFFFQRFKPHLTNHLHLRMI